MLRRPPRSSLAHTLFPSTALFRCCVYSIVLGIQLATSLGVRVGDTVLWLAPQVSSSRAGFAPRMRQFTVSKIFSSGYYEYDASLAFANYEDIGKVFRDSGVSGVRLRITDMQHAPQVARELRRSVPEIGRASCRERVCQYV